MSGDFLNMTGVSEGETPDVNEKESISQSDIDGKTELLPSQDFSLKKTCNAHLKMLVPSVAAGAIIGKNGEAITNIQNSTGAKVKMSKAIDFYPGTNERVCLIIGTTDAILEVYNYISGKIYEKPDTVTRVNSDNRVPFERHKQVKILVPNSTAGMIIGKAGSFIKEVKNKTGAFIQVSQKSKEMSLAERCITVGGELTQTCETMRLLLTKIAEDPQSTSCPNISYVDVSGPVASAYPTGSPYAIFLGSSSSPPSGNHQQQPPSCSSRTFYPQFSRLPSAYPSHLSPNDRGCLSPPNNSHFDSTATANGCRSNGMSTSRRPTTINNGRSHCHQHQSILGAASNNSVCGGIGSWMPNPSNTSRPFDATYNHLSSSSCNQNQHNAAEVASKARGVLQSAGYTDEAADEISQAIRILTIYGFMSMPNFGTNNAPVGVAPVAGLQLGCGDTLSRFTESINLPPPPLSQPPSDQNTFTKTTGVTSDKLKQTMHQSSTSSPTLSLIGSQANSHEPHHKSTPASFSPSPSPPAASPHRPPKSLSSFPIPLSENLAFSDGGGD